MNNKVNTFIEQYEKTLERKMNLVKPLHDKQNGLNILNEKEYLNMMVLEAEIRQLVIFIDDLKYINEE